ncbi:hypothetical protein LXL04_005495 [Taraxacum kok-saghyz]
MKSQNMDKQEDEQRKTKELRRKKRENNKTYLYWKNWRSVSFETDWSELTNYFTTSTLGIDLPWVLCPLCEDVGESLKHLFAACILIYLIWKKIAQWWNVEELQGISVQELFQWEHKVSSSTVIHQRFGEVIMITLWVIWKHRNNLLFGSVMPRLRDIFDNVRFYSFFWFVNRKLTNDFKISTLVTLIYEDLLIQFGKESQANY